MVGADGRQRNGIARGWCVARCCQTIELLMPVSAIGPGEAGAGGGPTMQSNTASAGVGVSRLPTRSVEASAVPSSSVRRSKCSIRRMTSLG